MLRSYHTKCCRHWSLKKHRKFTWKHTHCMHKGSKNTPTVPTALRKDQPSPDAASQKYAANIQHCLALLMAKGGLKKKVSLRATSQQQLKQNKQTESALKNEHWLEHCTNCNACYNLLVTTRELRKCLQGWLHCTLQQPHFVRQTKVRLCTCTANFMCRSWKFSKMEKIWLKLLVTVPVRTPMYSLVNFDAVRLRPHACFTTVTNCTILRAH